MSSLKMLQQAPHIGNLIKIKSILQDLQRKNIHLLKGSPCIKQTLPKKTRRITQVSSTPPYRNTGTPNHLVDPLLKVSGKKNEKLSIGHLFRWAKGSEYKTTA